MWAKIGKGLLILLLVLGGLLVLDIVAASLIYSPEYVGRFLAWRASDINDYLYNFPSRSLTAAAEPFYFEEAPAEDAVAGTFETLLNVADFDAFLEEMDTQALIVIQDDKVLYEKYFNGISRDSMLTSFSVAKSFTSTLVGLAVADGSIKSVDEPITNYLPELAARDGRFADITIRDLLHMSGGMAYQAIRPFIFNSDDMLTTYYPDQREAALKFTRLVEPPGQHFLYNKYYPQLLGMIIERSTGRSVVAYMQEKLWDPLGMEFSGSWSLDSEASGFEKMEAGVNARAIDYAKLGRLFLENGSWNGDQVLPATWVAESLQADPATLNDTYYDDEAGQVIFRDMQGYYGYMWYVFPRDGGAPDFVAAGDHGQIIYVSPQKNLIIVRNGFAYGADWFWKQWMETFYDFATTFAGGSTP